MGLNWLEQAKFQRECTTIAKGCWVRPKAKRDKWGYDTVGYIKAWKLWKGEPPPSGYSREHRCGRGALGCVNPYHMEMVTNSENRMRVTIRQNGQMPRPRLRMARLFHQRASG